MFGVTSVEQGHVADTLDQLRAGVGYERTDCAIPVRPIRAADVDFE